MFNPHLEAKAVANAEINIKGLEGYRNILGPIYEALGIDLYWVTGTGINQTSDSFAGCVPARQDESAAALAADVIDPIYNLVKQLVDAPVERVLEVLPMLSYCISMGMIQDLINTLSIDLEIRKLKDMDFTGVKLGVLTLTWLADWLAETIAGWVLGSDGKTINLDLGGMLDLAKLLGLEDKDDLENLNALIQFIFKKADINVTIPEFNAGAVATMGQAYYTGSGTNNKPNAVLWNFKTGRYDITKRMSTIRTKSGDGMNFDTSGNRQSSGSNRWYISAELGDVLYYLLANFVFGAFNSEQIDAIVTGFTGEPLNIDDGIKKVFDGITGNHAEAFAALVELLVPNTGSESVRFLEKVKVVESDGTFLYKNEVVKMSMTDAEWRQYMTDHGIKSANTGGYVYENIGSTDMSTGTAKGWVYSADENVWYEWITNRRASAYDFEDYEDYNNDATVNNPYVAGQTGTSVVATTAYLSYANQWSKEKAYTLFNGGINGITDLLADLGLKDDSGNPYDIGAMLNDLIDGLCSHDTVMVFLSLLSGLEETIFGAVKDDPDTPDVDESIEARENIAKFSNFINNQFDFNIFGVWNNNEVYPFTASYNDYFNTDGSPNTYYDWGFERAYPEAYKDAQTPVVNRWTPEDEDSNAGGTLEPDTLYSPEFKPNRQAFINAMSKIIAPIAPLIRWLFCGADFNILSGLDVDGNEVLIAHLKGSRSYSKSIAPLFEALGVNKYVAEELMGMQYAADFEEFRADSLSGTYNKIYMPSQTELDNSFDDRLAEVALAPIQSLLNMAFKDPVIFAGSILPNVVYFIQSGGLYTAVRNLLQNVFVIVDTLRPILNVDLDRLLFSPDYARDEDNNLIPMTTKDEFGNTVNCYYENPIEGSARIPVFELDKSQGLLGLVGNGLLKNFRINGRYYDLTGGQTSLRQAATLNGVLCMLESFTGLELTDVIYQSIYLTNKQIFSNAGAATLENTRSALSNHKYLKVVMKDLSTDAGSGIGGGDVITILLCVLIEIIEYSGDTTRTINGVTQTVHINNVTAASKLVVGFTDILGDTWQEVETTIQSLLDIFISQTELSYDTINWVYPYNEVDEQGNVVDGMTVDDVKEALQQEANRVPEGEDNTGDANVYQNKQFRGPVQTYANLNYPSDWTSSTAAYIDANLGAIIDNIIGIIPSLGAESLHDLLNNSFNLFSADILNTLAGLLGGLSGTIRAYSQLLNLALGIDLTALVGDRDAYRAKYAECKADGYDPAADTTAYAGFDKAYFNTVEGVSTPKTYGEIYSEAYEAKLVSSEYYGDDDHTVVNPELSVEEIATIEKNAVLAGATAAAEAKQSESVDPRYTGDYYIDPSTLTAPDASASPEEVAAYQQKVDALAADPARAYTATRENFEDQLAWMISPIEPVVSWLFLGENFAFFNGDQYAPNGWGSDLISLQGAEGYAYGYVPFIEALGCTADKGIFVKNAVQIKAENAAIDADDANYPTLADKNHAKGKNVIAAILNPLVDRIDQIMQDGDPVGELIETVNNLVYFLNADGLKASLNNLIKAVTNILDQLEKANAAAGLIKNDDGSVMQLDLDGILSGLVGFDLPITNLTTANILQLVEDLTANVNMDKAIEKACNAVYTETLYNGYIAAGIISQDSYDTWQAGLDSDATVEEKEAGEEAATEIKEAIEAADAAAVAEIKALAQEAYDNKKNEIDPESVFDQKLADVRNEIEEHFGLGDDESYVAASYAEYSAEYNTAKHQKFAANVAGSIYDKAYKKYFVDHPEADRNNEDDKAAARAYATETVEAYLDLDAALESPTITQEDINKAYESASAYAAEQIGRKIADAARDQARIDMAVPGIVFSEQETDYITNFFLGFLQLNADTANGWGYAWQARFADDFRDPVTGEYYTGNAFSTEETGYGTRADFVTCLVAELIILLEDKGTDNGVEYDNPKAISRLLGLDDDAVDTIIGLVNGSIALKYSYNDWLYFVNDGTKDAKKAEIEANDPVVAGASADVTVGGELQNVAADYQSIAHLSYPNDWTKEKATNLSDNIDAFADAIVTMVTKGNGDYTKLSDWVLSLVGGVFSDEMLNNLVWTVAGLLYTAEVKLGAVLGVGEKLLGLDLSAWQPYIDAYKAVYEGAENSVKAACLAADYDPAADEDNGEAYTAAYNAYLNKNVAEGVEPTEADLAKAKEAAADAAATAAAEKAIEAAKKNYASIYDEAYKAYIQDNAADPEHPTKAEILDAKAAAREAVADYDTTVGDPILGASFGVDAAETAGMTDAEATDAKKDAFLNAVYTLLTPLNKALGWILFGDGYKFLVTHDFASHVDYSSNEYTVTVDPDNTGDYLLQIQGGEGYETGLLVLYEILGAAHDDLKSRDEVMAAYNGGTETAYVDAIVTPLVDLIEDILYADKPVTKVLELVNNLIYGLNSGALGIVISNVLAPVVGLLDAVNDSGLLSNPISLEIGGLDLAHLNTSVLLDFLTESTGIEVAGIECYDTYGTRTTMGRYIMNHLVGDLYRYKGINTAITYADYYKEDNGTFRFLEKGETSNITSAEDIAAVNRIIENNAAYYRVLFNPETGKGSAGDFLTILISLVLQIAEAPENRAPIVKLLAGTAPTSHVVDGETVNYTAEEIAALQAELNAKAEQKYDAIMGLITGNYDITYKDYDWFYFITDATEKAQAQAFTNYASAEYAGTDYQTYRQMSYPNDWTALTADYFARNIDTIVDELIPLVTGYKFDEETGLPAVDDEGNQIGYANLSELVSSLLTGLYTDKTASTLFYTIWNLTTAIDESLLNFVGSTLNCDFGAWDTYKAQFIAAYDTELAAASADDYDWENDEVVMSDGSKVNAGKAYKEAYDKAIEDGKTEEEAKTAGAEAAAKAVQSGYVYDFGIDAASDRVNKELAFKDMLNTTLSPVSGIIAWLFFGRDYKFFVNTGYGATNPETGELYASPQDLLTLKGANGFDTGLIPLFEALGATVTTNAATALAAYENGDSNALIAAITDPLFNLIDGLLDSPAMVTKVLGILNNLIYFIDAGGLTAAVNNLISGVNSILTVLAPLTSDLDLGNLNIPEGSALTLDALIASFTADLGIDISLSDLSMSAILGLVTALTDPDKDDDSVNGLTFDTVDGRGYTIASYITNWLVGKVHCRISANGSYYCTLDFTDVNGEPNATGTGNSGDFLSVLVALLLQIFEDPANKDAVVGIIANLADKSAEEATAAYENLMNILHGVASGDERSIDWFYFVQDEAEKTLAENYKDGTTGISEADYNSVMAKYQSIVHLAYPNDWTVDTAQYLSDNIDRIVDAVIKLVKVEIGEDETTGESVYASSLNELINSLIPEFYTDQMMTLIVTALAGLLEMADETIGKVLGLATNVLGVDLEHTNYDEVNTLKKNAGTIAYNAALEDGKTEEEANAAREKAESEYAYDFGIDSAANKGEKFAEVLALELAPLARLIGWLFFGQDYNFFVSTDYDTGKTVVENGQKNLITIRGGNGWNNGLAQILAALGCEDLKDAETIQAEYAVQKADGIDNNETAYVDAIVEPIIGLVDSLLTSTTQVSDVLGILNNIIYFSNSGALGVAVTNIVAPVLNILNALSDSGIVTGLNISDVLGSIMKDEEAGYAGLDLLNLDTAKLLTFAEYMISKNLGADLKIGSLPVNIIDADVTGATTLGEYIVRHICGIPTYYAYDSEGTAGITGERVRFTDTAGTGSSADFLTELVSLLLQVIIDSENEDAVKAIIKKISGLDDETADRYYQAVINLVQSDSLNREYSEDYDWFYFITDEVEKSNAQAITNYATGTYNPYTDANHQLFAAFSYPNDWTATASENISDNIEAIVNNILKLANVKLSDGSTDAETLNALLKDLLENKLFTEANAETVYTLIHDLITSIDETLIEFAFKALNCDLSAWDTLNEKLENGESLFGIEETDSYEVKSQKFESALYQILSPISRVLAWLLYGQDYRFFVTTDSHDELVLGGNDGYNTAIYPLFKALEMTPLYATTAAVVGAYEGGDEDAYVKALITPIFTKVNSLLASEYIINDAMSIINNLFYFINANGLSVVVTNLLAGVNEILAGVAAFAGDDFSSINHILAKALESQESEHLRNLQLDTLTLENIIGIVEDMTGVKIWNVVDSKGDKLGSYMGTLACGEIDTYLNYKGAAFHTIRFSNANGVEAQAGTGTSGDFLTILLSFILQAVEAPENKDVICGFIKGMLPTTYTDIDNNEIAYTEEELAENAEALYDTIMSLIKGSAIPEAVNVDWFYFVQDDDAKTTAQNTYTTQVFGAYQSIVHLAYPNDWTVETADYLTTNIDRIADIIINMVLGNIDADEETGVKTMSIGPLDIDVTEVDTLKGLLSAIVDTALYSDALMTTIVKAIYTLIDGLSDDLGAILGVATNVLGIDLEHTDWTLNIKAAYEAAGSDAYDAAIADGKTEEEANAAKAQAQAEFVYDFGIDSAADKAAQFTQVLSEEIKPLNRVLGWLLFGQSYQFFVSTDYDTSLERDSAYNADKHLLTVSGGIGWDTGLAHILVALGATDVESAAQATATGTDYCYTEALVRAIVSIVENLKNSDTAVTDLVGIINNLIYFINAGGLKAAVANIASPALGIISKILASGIRIDALNDFIDDEGHFKLVLLADPDNEVYPYAGLNILDLTMTNLLEFAEYELSVLAGAPLLVANLECKTVYPGMEGWDGGDDVSETTTTFANYLIEHICGVIAYYSFGDGAITGRKSVFSNVYDSSMTSGTGTFGDFLTELISLLLQVVLDDQNADALQALLIKIMGDEAKAQQVYNAILAFSDPGSALEPDAIDWFYFSPELSGTQPVAGTVYNFSSSASTYSRVMNILDYDNNWNADVAEYLVSNVDGITNLVIQIISGYAENGDSTHEGAENLAEYLRDMIGSFYSETYLNQIGWLLGNLIFQYGDILEAAGALIGIDFSYFRQFVSEEGEQIEVDFNGDGSAESVLSQTQFVNELMAMLTSINRVVEWLFFGKNFEFFVTTDNQTELAVKGFDGYDYGWVPFLEALGCFVADDANAVLARYEAGEEDALVRALIDPLIERVNNLLEEENLVNDALWMIDNLIYFIDTGALKAAVNNILKPVNNILTAIQPLTNFSLDSIEVDGAGDTTIVIPVTDLTMDNILNLVTAFTAKEKDGAVIPGVSFDAVMDIIETWNVGKVEGFNTYVNPNTIGNTTSARMLFAGTAGSGTSAADFLTIVVTVALLIVDDPNNAAILKELLGEKVYVSIQNALHLKDLGQYQTINWHPTSGVWNPTSGSPMFEGSGYGRYWTKEKAKYVNNHWAAAIDHVVHLLGIKLEIGGKELKINSLKDLLSGLLDQYLYTDDIVTKIGNALMDKALGRLYSLTGEDGKEYVVNVVKKLLGVDLTAFEQIFAQNEDGDWVYQLGHVSDRESFEDALCNILAPVAPLLKWLLCDDPQYDIRLFNDTEGVDLVILPSAKGYQNAFVPLLEALKCSVVSAEQFETDAQGEDGNYLLVHDILDPIFDRLDFIMEDPANRILDLLSNLIYFIEAGGLDAAVKNLIHSVSLVLGSILPILSDEYAANAEYNTDAAIQKEAQDNAYKYLLSLINKDLTPETLLNWRTLITFALKALEERTGYEFAQLAIDAIAELVCGEIEDFVSKSDLDSDNNPDTAYRVNYTVEASRTDMITLLLRIAMEFLITGDNAESLKGLLRDNVDNEEAQKYLFALIDTLTDAVKTDPKNHVDIMLGTLYYIFYGVDVAATESDDYLTNYSETWSWITNLMENGGGGTLASIADALQTIFNMGSGSGDSGDSGSGSGDSGSGSGGSQGGQMNFLQRLMALFQRIAEFFRNLFSRRD
ncbi:MAG: hypothetical protein IJT56_01100 [Clostridia bacterium]|nr:hypothetical protein [Clostridia bacterium]